MPNVVRSAADYLAALKALLPRGPIWRAEPGSVMEATLSGLAPSFARSDARAANLLIDAFPRTTSELLSEWEATLGLPDCCTGLLPTVQQRQAQVVARLIATGGASKQYFIDLAAAIGVTIEIKEYKVARAGSLRAGNAVNGADFAYVWRVNILGTVVETRFRAGRSRAGEPLLAIGTNGIECMLNRLKPAHTILVYGYVTVLGDDLGNPLGADNGDLLSTG